MSRIGLMVLSLLLGGCSLSLGRKYSMEKNTTKVFCTPCLNVGDRGRGLGIIWYETKGED